MEQRLMQSQSFEFIRRPWDKVNRSGCRPIGDMVLVLIDEVAQQTAGGLFMPEDTLYKRQLAAETGTIVAMGEGAFYWNAERSRPWVSDDKPKVGDHILFSRYAGREIQGYDKKMYRVMMDKEIGGIATDEGFSMTVREKVVADQLG